MMLRIGFCMILAVIVTNQTLTAGSVDPMVVFTPARELSPIEREQFVPDQLPPRLSESAPQAYPSRTRNELALSNTWNRLSSLYQNRLAIPLGLAKPAGQESPMK